MEARVSSEALRSNPGSAKGTGVDIGSIILKFTFCRKLLILQEAKESFASPDNSFYGKLHIVELLYQ